MTHAAFIDTQNVGVGKGGDISINSKNLLLGDEIVNEKSFTDIGLYGYIGSPAAGSGPGGNIDIYAENITVRNGFSIINVEGIEKQIPVMSMSQRLTPSKLMTKGA